MIIRDLRAEALARLAKLGLEPGYYWIKSQGEPWQPAHLMRNGFLEVLGCDYPVSTESVTFGARIEPPEGT